MDFSIPCFWGFWKLALGSAWGTPSLLWAVQPFRYKDGQTGALGDNPIGMLLSLTPVAHCATLRYVVETPPINVRLCPEVVGRLERLAEVLRERYPGMRYTRSDALRLALEEGMGRLEKRLRIKR